MLFARFFDSDRNPLGVETRYDAAGDFPIGYAPNIFEHLGTFFPAYVYPNPFTLDDQIKFAAFDGDGDLRPAQLARGRPEVKGLSSGEGA